MKARLRKIIIFACLFTSLCSFCSCKSKAPGVVGVPSSVAPTSPSQAAQPGTFPAGEILLPEKSGTANEITNAGIDYGNAADGYIMAWYTGEKQAKLQVKMDETKYNYDLNNEGNAEVFPLQLGNGAYTIKVLEQTEGTMYLPIVTQEIQVTLKTEFEPFLRPSQYSNYNADSLSAQKGRELASGCASDVEIVSKVYEYIKENIKYDAPKAEVVTQQTDYLPDPDETLQTGKGICFDYASLVCAMLRSNGIPTKLITGYVSPSGLYHAWNEIYLQNEGWVEMKIYVDLKTWKIIDLTFAAGMSSQDIANYIGDGENYTTRYVY